MTNPTDLMKTLRELPEEEKRFVFRELAKDLLDPRGELELTFCDNEGNVLGYFEPVLRRMRSQANEFVEPVDNIEKILKDSEPAEEFFDRTLHVHREED